MHLVNHSGNSGRELTREALFSNAVQNQQVWAAGVIGGCNDRRAESRPQDSGLKGNLDGALRARRELLSAIVALRKVNAGNENAGDGQRGRPVIGQSYGLRLRASTHRDSTEVYLQGVRLQKFYRGLCVGRKRIFACGQN